MQCDASVPVEDGSGSVSGAIQSNNVCVASTMAAATIVVTPLCLMRSIESLGPTSTLGACCVLFTSVVVAFTGFNEPETDPEFAWKPVQMRLTAFQAIPIVCFATMCHFTVVPATAALRPYFEKPRLYVVSSSTSRPYAHQSDRDTFGSPPGWKDIKVLVLLCCCVMLWCNFLYVPVGVLGYRAFGSQASSNILDNFGQHSKSAHFVRESVAVLVARACMCTTTCLSYPIFTFITRMAIVDVLYSNTDAAVSSMREDSTMEGGASLAAGLSTVKHVTITVFFLIFCAISGIAVVWADISLGFTVSVIGATVVVAVEFFLPA
jgi:amino acid permease